jgi:hypothetical protein
MGFRLAFLRTFFYLLFQSFVLFQDGVGAAAVDVSGCRLPLRAVSCQGAAAIRSSTGYCPLIRPFVLRTNGTLFVLSYWRGLWSVPQKLDSQLCRVRWGVGGCFDLSSSSTGDRPTSSFFSVAMKLSAWALSRGLPLPT